MSGIDPSKDKISRETGLSAGYAGAPTTTDKLDHTRHLLYGQTENQKKSDAEESREKEEKEGSSHQPTTHGHHTFMEEFQGGLTGDDIIEEEDRREKERIQKERERKEKKV
ncbi:hypothetical protein G9A89_010683 [Geosiphon pyriformis]|nr:hypothetical protein G9A89_010683 [Geosiphon pyriformis]